MDSPLPSDKGFRVRWVGGEIILHGKDSKSVINVLLEYLRVPDANRIVVTEIIAEEMRQHEQ